MMITLRTTLIAAIATGAVVLMSDLARAQRGYKGPPGTTYTVDRYHPGYYGDHRTKSVRGRGMSYLNADEKFKRMKLVRAEEMEREIWKKKYGAAVPAGYGTVNPALLSPEARAEMERQAGEIEANKAHQTEAQRQHRMQPDALELLRSMSQYVGGLENFKMKVRDIRNTATPKGQNVQVRTDQTFTVTRPNKLHLRTANQETDSEVWFDGKAITVMNHEDQSYSTIGMPGTLGSMMQRLYTSQRFIVPVADLLFSDLYGKMHASITRAQVVGPKVIDNRRCTHLLASSGPVHWQIWITEGPRPVPVRLLVDYPGAGDVGGVKRYVAAIDKVEPLQKVDPNVFAFNPPAKYEKGDFQAVASTYIER